MLFLFLLFSVTATTADETFENATNICQRCECTQRDNAQVLTLNCSDRNLRHMLSFWPPHNATIIAIFNNNNITTLETLPPTDAVVEIALSRCHIRSLHPVLFDNAKNIKSADLSYNLLTAEELTPAKFMGPYNHSLIEPIKLEELNLAYNQIHTLNKNIFEYLPDLKRLDLEGNDFVVLDAQTQLALSSLTRLVSLNLANNELTELVKAAIEGCNNLSELNLSKNQLDFVPSSLVTVAKTLEILILDDNPIMELTGESFTWLETLHELSLNHLTKIERIEANTFASLSKLRKLSVSDNAMLQAIDEEAFGTNQTIQELYLNNDKLEHIHYKLLKWSELNIFEINGNPLDCSCDLHNITVALSGDITRNKDGPYCKDPRDDRPTPIYELSSDICSVKSKKTRKRRYYSISVPLAVLITTMIFGLFVAVSLTWNRYRRFLNRNHPAASQVLYNPLPTSSRM